MFDAKMSLSLFRGKAVLGQEVCAMVPRMVGKCSTRFPAGALCSLVIVASGLSFPTEERALENHLRSHGGRLTF